MNPRQARRDRREAERKAKKLEVKKSRLAENEFPEIQPRWNPELEDEFPREVQIRNNAMADRVALKLGLPIPPSGPSPVFKTTEDIRQHFLDRRKAATGSTQSGFVSQTNPSRAEINRANAQLSTGPTSTNGKLASSRNSLKHGLASGQLIIPGEDPAVFDSFLSELLAEHQPANSTEELLIKEMAQSHWLHQRAIRLQNSCFTEEGIDQKGLALFLRYGTTHERAFYKALNTLLKLQKQNRQTQIGFVSQTRSIAADQIGFVSQTPANPPPARVGAAHVRPAPPASPLDPAKNSGFVSQKEGPEATERTRLAKEAA